MLIPNHNELKILRNTIYSDNIRAGIRIKLILKSAINNKEDTYLVPRELLQDDSRPIQGV